jgi:hypothetical protein
MEVRKMPTSIYLTIAALVLLLAINFAAVAVAVNSVQGPAALVRLGVSAGLGMLILWGVIVGNRLAWQWGRFLGLLAGLLLLLAGIFVFTGGPAGVPPAARILAGGILLAQAICVYTIFFSLGRPSAREHFRLRCPSCGKFTTAAADFFFKRAKCKGCQTVW